MTLLDSEGTKLASTTTRNAVEPVTSPCVTVFEFAGVPKSEVYTLTAGDSEAEISHAELEEEDFLWTFGTPLPEPSDETVCDIGDRAMETLRHATPTSWGFKDWNWEVRDYRDELEAYAASLIWDGEQEEGVKAREAADSFAMIIANGGVLGDEEDLADLNEDAQKILGSLGPIYTDAGCGTFRVPTYTETETGTPWDLA